MQAVDEYTSRLSFGRFPVAVLTKNLTIRCRGLLFGPHPPGTAAAAAAANLPPPHCPLLLCYSNTSPPIARSQRPCFVHLPRTATLWETCGGCPRLHTSPPRPRIRSGTGPFFQPLDISGAPNHDSRTEAPQACGPPSSLPNDRALHICLSS